MVKKILIASALLASMSASASNYLTLGVNDTVRILPSYLGGFAPVYLGAHFEGRLDTWSLELYMPTGMSVYSSQEGSDMTITYTGFSLQDTIYDVSLAYNPVVDGYGLAAHIPVIGYWDYDHDGKPNPYGTAKWEGGDYNDMVRFTIYVNSAFRGGSIILTGYLSSSNDNRGGVINPNPCPFQRTITVTVGYRLGDVNGDGVVSVGDIATLSAYLLNGYGLDEFQLEAA
ncbi:MAG: dockerin type I repeat-containing protein, partial [Muribaculaceae bacterium]|nr:dockerin type I repeat-containing protein [Muribaculaceae bacterium]